MLPAFLFGYKSQIRLLLGALLVLTSFTKSAGQNVTLLEKAEQFLQIGLIDSTENLIHQGLKLHANDPIQVARFYDLLGEVSKFKGDLDVSLEHWNLAIELRKNTFRQTILGKHGITHCYQTITTKKFSLKAPVFMPIRADNCYLS
jgi:hypothetical protein